MDFLFFKLAHLIGVMLLFIGLGGAAFVSYAGVDWTKTRIKLVTRMFHSVGLLLILVAGVMMVHELKIYEGGVPLWVKLKMAVLLSFGPLFAVLARKPNSIKIILPLSVVLGGAAGFLALYKPF